MIPTPILANNIYHCLEDENEKKVVTDNQLHDKNNTSTAEISDDYSIDSDEGNTKINPSKIHLSTRSQSWEKPSLKGILWSQMVFITSNTKIAVDMAIVDSGATGNFSLPGTPVKNIKPAEKPL